MAKKKSTKVKWTMKKLPDGRWSGTVQLPLNFGMTPVRVKATSSDGAAAVRKAASLASKVAENPLLAAIMPPGTPNAIKAIDAIADKGPAVLKKFAGPGVKRVKKALSKLFW